MLLYIYKGFGILKRSFSLRIDYILTLYKFKCFGVNYSDFETSGVPFIDVSLKNASSITVGKRFRMNNGAYCNQIGFGNLKCTLIADGGNIKIGDNVGVSQTAILAFGDDINIGDNVKIGGGVRVYTTDFHSLDYANRRNRSNDTTTCKHACVTIGNDCFIGAGSVILKGVTIGDRAIIGAGSVVTRNIPSDTIYAGNPAREIKKLIYVEND